MYTSRLSSRGRVTMPSEVREFLRLGTGDLVGYEVRGEEVVLRRIEPFDAFHGVLSATLEEWGSPEDEEAFREL